MQMASRIARKPRSSIGPSPARHSLVQRKSIFAGNGWPAHNDFENEADRAAEAVARGKSVMVEKVQSAGAVQRQELDEKKRPESVPPDRKPREQPPYFPDPAKPAPALKEDQQEEVEKSQA